MTKKPLSPLLLGTICALVAAMTFGLWPPASRAVYADGGNSVAVALVHTWMRALGMVIYCCMRKYSLFGTRNDVRQGLIGGLLQAITVLGVYKSTEYLPGAVALIIFYSHTLILFFYMVWKKEETIDIPVIISTLAALLGLSFAVDVWHSQGTAHLIGIFFSLCAALATVSRLYVYGRQIKERNPIVVGAENFIMASIMITLFLPVQPPVFPSHLYGFTWILIGGVAATVGTFGMFYSISLLGSFRYSLFMKLEPVFTALFSAWLIHEFLKPIQYFGMALVLVSLAAYQLIDHRKKAAVLSAEL